MLRKLKALDAIGLIALILSLLLLSWAGLIWAIAIGFAFGSYATSIVSRWPKRILHVKRDPYCMSCNKELQPRDLYPLLSYLCNKGKCRFCGASIPTSLFWTEFLVIISSIICYLVLGIGVWYIVILILASVFIATTVIFVTNLFIK